MKSKPCPECGGKMVSHHPLFTHCPRCFLKPDPKSVKEGKRKMLKALGEKCLEK